MLLPSSFRCPGSLMPTPSPKLFARFSQRASYSVANMISPNPSQIRSLEPCKDWTIRGFLSSEGPSFRFSIRLFANRTLEH
ncbi:hypothetical protein RB10200 [Rhodopirellula baltica SH 1]|uniref:Uncharacterized protein n=1 Tax=Rhodopirellula baltica (strain DSM 10527 / NCIMB 13988 / SH1) TaxID=243090 RepID=Q7UFC5_RHOBA|nr:hypothetical protein RB10200 [Rhodopirellula baltica SH 1]